jgi:hypothetical protein
MKKLENTLVLNEKQIASAKERTAEELRIYNQGRGELNFVLRGQDGEQNAKLRYAETAAHYQLLHLRLQEILDRLLIEQNV